MAAAAASIRLSPVDMAHADAMYRWMLDPVVAGNLGLRHEPSLARTREWIARAADRSAFLALAIYCEERHVGNLVFDQIDEADLSARLSIYIGDAGERNKGLGTLAMTAGLSRAFTERGLRTVWLTVHDDNERARHVYAKLGFRATDAGRMILPREVWFRLRGGRDAIRQS